MTFLDIETVPLHSGYRELTEDLTTHRLWHKKFKSELEEKHNGEEIYERNGLYAEFGKVVCVSLGIIVGDKIRIKNLYNRDEKELLKQLSEILGKTKSACAHNGLEFDFPFLMRRYIINGLPLPELLQIAGKKPWELQLEDTMKMWSGSAWNYKVSLDLLAHILGLESPKTEMDESQVAELFYSNDEEGSKTKISAYCSKDVITLANCYNRIKGLPVINQIEML